MSGATAATYALTSADLGFAIQLTVTATNSVGHASASSGKTAIVTAAPPQNTVPPSISGTVSDGQTLTASKGSWTGSAPITYAYQWDRCDGAGLSCTNIAGATATTYLLAAADEGNELRVIVTATNSRGVVSATSAASNVVTPTGSGACSDVWSGRAGDNQWTSAGNWSAGRVPGSSDRACAGAATSVTVSADAAAGSLYSAGELSIADGSLSLDDAQSASSVDTLTETNAGTLTGAATLTVTSHLDWEYGTQSGTGTTVLAAGATGVFDANGGAYANGTLDTRTLRNLGTLTFVDGYLNASNGATIDNQGTLLLNSQSDRHHPAGELRARGRDDHARCRQPAARDRRRCRTHGDDHLRQYGPHHAGRL